MCRRKHTGSGPASERSGAVSSELQIDLDSSIRRVFSIPAGEAGVRRAMAALEANGIRVLRAADASEAKRIVLSLIPHGSQVHHGASESLEVSGITEEIESSGRYQAVRPRIRNLDRRTRPTRSAACRPRLT